MGDARVAVSNPDAIMAPCRPFPRSLAHNQAAPAAFAPLQAGRLLCVEPCCNGRMKKRQAMLKTVAPRRAATDRLNWINSGLMLAACGAAYLAPFHLFLLAYAILGPLHYITEISWLHDRSYFANHRPARRWWLILVAATMVVLMFGYIANDLLHRPVPPKYEIAMVYLVLATASIALYVRHIVNATPLVAAAIVAIVLFSRTRTFFLLAYFLVTIIHVLIFTAAFVMYGAIRSRSWAALMSAAVLVLCAASFFVFEPTISAPPESLRQVYSFFEPLNIQLAKLFGLPQGSIYESLGGVAVMRLIAFAYTYHYLNWFSKTSIIRWHEVPRSRAIAMAVLWLAAIALYFFNYSTGLTILYAGSLLHVLLEFPLDIQTFVGIGRELRTLMWPPALRPDTPGI